MRLRSEIRLAPLPTIAPNAAMLATSASRDTLLRPRPDRPASGCAAASRHVAAQAAQQYERAAGARIRDREQFVAAECAFPGAATGAIGFIFHASLR